VHGDFVYSAILGGSRDGTAIGVALGAGSSALVVGETSSAEGFPAVNPLQGFGGQSDAFIVRIVAPDLPPRFHRGDANTNGIANLSDAIFIFLFLFIGGEAPSCMEAADTDNSGGLNLTDGIFLLQYLFLGGPEPPPPGVESSPCGPDPDPAGTAKALGCDAYPPCAA
jgi:hypothetical protein